MLTNPVNLFISVCVKIEFLVTCSRMFLISIQTLQCFVQLVDIFTNWTYQPCCCFLFHSVADVMVPLNFLNVIVFMISIDVRSDFFLFFNLIR